MKSTSEVGHEKNIENLEQLINSYTGFGSAYNPARTALKIPQLIIVKNAANAAMLALKKAKTAKDNADNTRKTLFDNLQKLSTRIFNSILSSDASPLTIADVKTYHRKIQGKRASVIPSDAAKNEQNAEVNNEVKKHSTSQKSFINQIAHFTQIITVLTAEPLYVPNEADLKLTALNTLLTSMKSLHANAKVVDTAYDNALIARDDVMYKDKTGLTDVSLASKTYVKSAFGVNSSQYKQISHLKFINFRRKR